MTNLFYVFLALLLINCVVGCYALLIKKMGKNILPLFLAVACSFLDEILGHYFKIKYKNNLAVYYFGDALEYTFFAWFLFANINNKIVTRLIAASIFILLLISVLYGYIFIGFVYTDPYKAIIINNYGIVIRGLFLTIWSICYFRGMFNSISRYEPLNIYVMLVAAGMLFYYAFSTMFFSAETYLINRALKENPHLFSDIVKQKRAAFTYAYNQIVEIKIFLYLTNILLYLCILVALLKTLLAKKKYKIGF